MKPTLLILAAGMGSRFGGLKQIEPVGINGETIIEYSIYDAIRAGFGKVVFVIRKSFYDAFKERFEQKLLGKIEIEYVFQELDKLPKGYTLPSGREKPWGTGHAILMAKEVINEPFAAINADDFYGKEAYSVMFDFLTNKCNDNSYSMIGYQLDNTLSDFGSVSRGLCETNSLGHLTKITETHKIEQIDKTIQCESENKDKVQLTGKETVSMNFWGFSPSVFDRIEKQFIDFLENKIDDPKSELYIPFVVFDIIKNNEANVEVLKADSPWFGVTYKDDKPMVIEKIKQLTNLNIYPQKLW